MSTNISLSYQTNNRMNFGITYNNMFEKIRELTAPYINCRIIQKNLVYFIGLSSKLIEKEADLKSYEYFGQYGKIVKLVLNKNKIYNSNGPNGPSYACYVTYSNETESSLAILAMDNAVIDKHIIKASYGTTKYCLNFLRNSICTNKDCIYLHYLADPKDIVSREEMNSNKELFTKQRIRAIELSRIISNDKYLELEKAKNIKTFFPNGFTVYENKLVQKYINEQNDIPLIFFKFKDLKDKEIINKNINNVNNKKENNIIKFSKYKNNSFIRNTNELYKPRERSRFDFATGAEESIKLNDEYKIPEELTTFISNQFIKHSVLLKKEQNDINDYYFNLPQKSKDSNDNWSDLIKTLKMWNDFNETSYISDENVDGYVSTTKFNTY